MRAMEQLNVLVCSPAAVILAMCFAGSLSLSNNFHAVTDCSCSQDIVTYECTVCGLATAWEGTALASCSGGEIALTNGDFMPPIQTIVCNGGVIAVRGISVQEGCFTSQLTVTLNTTLQGRTVICSVDNGTHASQVGSATLEFSTESYPLPESVMLAQVSPSTGLFFSWNQTQNCPSLHYSIVSENCGRCPNTTESTSVNCTDFTIINSITLCTFAVQTVICGNSGMPLIVSNLSDSVTVNLTVPPISQVTIIPNYHIENGLRSLTVIFSEINPFMIYDGIDGSVIAYTINYTDSNTGEFCGSDSASCVNGICVGGFNVSSSSCRPSSDINVTVFTVTNLGLGPPTIPMMEDYQNNFVRVQITSEPASINCTFLSVIKGLPPSCDAVITYGQNCEEQMMINGMRDNDLVVVISLTSFLEDTMSSKYCSFRVNATANMRTVTVDGNIILAITISSSSSRSAIIAAAVVPVAIISTIFVVIILLIYVKTRAHRGSADINGISLQSVKVKFKIVTVPEKCNMIDFAKSEIKNYDPDSGYGYYQFLKTAEEYISPKTQVVLVNEGKDQKCTGRTARGIIGVSDKREKMKLRDLGGTKWKYVFIQSTSRIRMLPKDSLFLYFEGEKHTKKEPEQRKVSRIKDESLILVDDNYITLTRVPGDREYPVLEFTKTIKEISNYCPSLGYGFYEFTKPEYIWYEKQVILMDKDGRLHYGPGARSVIGIGPGVKYDETVEVEPRFDTDKWKCVLVQTRSNVRKLQPNTWFLYCDVASSEMIMVLEPFELLSVPEAEEDERKVLKFAKKNIPYYDPKPCYAYYEFTGTKYITSDKNIMALKENGELFTGPGVFKLAGVGQCHDETKEIKAPDLKGTGWKCIFIQGRKGYGRLLEPNTQFLYCEYDYNPEFY